MTLFQTILAPTDHSDCSRKALRTAARLAAQCGGTLHVLFVGERPADSTWDDNHKARVELSALEGQEASLREAFELAAGGLPLQPVFHVTAGDPSVEIVRMADELHADLIVMGTHGGSGIRSFFVGSNASRVVEKATCAVLAIKPDGYPFLKD